MQKLLSKLKAGREDQFKDILERLKSKADTPRQKLIDCRDYLKPALTKIHLKLTNFEAEQQSAEFDKIIEFSPRPKKSQPEPKISDSDDAIEVKSSHSLEEYLASAKLEDLVEIRAMSEERDVTINLDSRDLKEDIRILDNFREADPNIIFTYLLVRMLSPLSEKEGASVEKYVDNIIACLKVIKSTDLYRVIQPDLHELIDIRPQLSKPQSSPGLSYSSSEGE